MNRFCALNIYLMTIFNKVNTFIKLFQNTTLYFCTFSTERSKTIEDWNIINTTLNQSSEIHDDINKLFNEARTKLFPNDALLVTGSFFLLSDLNFESNK